MTKLHGWLIAFGALGIATGIGAASRGAAADVTAPAAQAAALVIRDARVFDGERMHEKASVLVEHGRIAAIGASVTAPAGAAVVDGAGKTLLPGFIDAHAHAFGDALERALVFGVTTELDMFTAHQAVSGWRAQQKEGAPGRADIFSAGTLVTAPKGHGTEYGMVIPTISSPEEAQAFVDARIAEGSDYIKIVFDDREAAAPRFPSITYDTLKAVIAAAKARGKLAV
ncbi:MAG: hypothetical protein M3R55_17325, partial [Acidobacteriota bacterium]|nr:hypothetical protein [Acidobacteriota bacterium]